jgi:hypothetical protein
LGILPPDQLFITSFDFMTDFDEVSKRARLSAILEKLVECGWVDGSFLHDVTGNYALRWTPKGAERARWVNLISEELDLGPQGMLTLIAICKQHGATGT